MASRQKKMPVGRGLLSQAGHVTGVAKEMPMSNMENLDAALEESQRRDAAFREAVRNIETDDNRRMARGHALMAMAMSYGSASQGSGLFGKLSHAAQLFCIAFAFVAPILLFIKVVL
jgi:hypothetical protein